MVMDFLYIQIFFLAATSWFSWICDYDIRWIDLLDTSCLCITILEKTHRRMVKVDQKLQAGLRNQQAQNLFKEKG
jgi:hypothetical protein